ncbi:MAG: NUDIX domain-containing protein, partial [archaeon]
MLLTIGNKNYRKTVFIVVYRIVNNKRFYFVLKRKLHWRGYEFPKGGIEEGETELGAVKREVFEETGLKIKKIINHHKTGKYNYSRKLQDRKDVDGQTYSLYSAEVEDGEVSLDKHEHTSFQWLSYTEAINVLSHINQK